MTFRSFVLCVIAVSGAFSAGLAAGIHGGLHASNKSDYGVTSACLKEIDELKIDNQAWEFLCAAVESENLPPWPGRMPR